MVDLMRFKKGDVRDIEFLNMVSKHKSVSAMNDKTAERAQDLGIAEEDTFRIVGLTEKDGIGTLHIVTSGEEGEKYAKDVLMKLKKLESVKVVNDRAERCDTKCAEDTVVALQKASDRIRGTR